MSGGHAWEWGNRRAMPVLCVNGRTRMTRTTRMRGSNQNRAVVFLIRGNPLRPCHPRSAVLVRSLVRNLLGSLLCLFDCLLRPFDNPDELRPVAALVVANGGSRPPPYPRLVRRLPAPFGAAHH